MTSINDPQTGYGSPPAKHQFGSGNKGNLRGRPVGSQNTKTVVQAIAREKHSVKHQGRTIKLTTVELLLHLLRMKAMRGDLAANKALEKLLDRVCPPNDGHGFLLVPEVMPPRVWVELAEKRNARAKCPK